MGKRTRLILLAFIVVLLGFLRDYLFYNINWVYKTQTENRPLQARKEFHFLMEWQPDAILTLKWILTVSFFLLFTLLTWFVIKIAFENKLYNRIAILFFAGLLIVSGLLFVIYKTLDSPGSIYAVIRTLMGLGQSFVPLILLYLTFKFFPKPPQIEQEY